MDRFKIDIEEKIVLITSFFENGRIQIFMEPYNMGP
jgi:hypothetical protein